MILFSSEEQYDERTAKRLAISKHRKISGMPPIAPYAAVRDNIKASVFDFLWAEVRHLNKPKTKRDVTVYENTDKYEYFLSQLSNS